MTDLVFDYCRNPDNVLFYDPNFIKDKAMDYNRSNVGSIEELLFITNSDDKLECVVDIMMEKNKVYPTARILNTLYLSRPSRHYEKLLSIVTNHVDDVVNLILKFPLTVKIFIFSVENLARYIPPLVRAPSVMDALSWWLFNKEKFEKDIMEFEDVDDDVEIIFSNYNNNKFIIEFNGPRGKNFSRAPEQYKYTSDIVSSYDLRTILTKLVLIGVFLAE
jgi:hypothetical protein